MQFHDFIALITILPVFMSRSHIPKLKIAFPSEALVPSDSRPYRNLAFYNVLARRGSLFCNSTRLNFPASALGDGAARELAVAWVRKMSNRFGFC